MPNRSMPASPYPTPGALLMGDAFNMRHPLTGGGMTVALSDIVVLRDLLKPLHNLNDAAALCKYLEAFYTLRKVSTWSYVPELYLAMRSTKPGLNKNCKIINLRCVMVLFAASGIHNKHIGRSPI